MRNSLWRRDASRDREYTLLEYRRRLSRSIAADNCAKRNVNVPDRNLHKQRRTGQPGAFSVERITWAYPWHVHRSPTRGPPSSRVQFAQCPGPCVLRYPLTAVPAPRYPLTAVPALRYPLTAVPALRYPLTAVPALRHDPGYNGFNQRGAEPTDPLQPTAKLGRVAGEELPGRAPAPTARATRRRMTRPSWVGS